MVEFAIMTPILLMLTLGATDFARVFVESQALAGSSHSGSTYGARRHIDSVDYAEIKARALAGADGATAAAELFCDCPDNPGVSVSCTNGTCGTYGSPRTYVKTTIEKPFSTLAKYPGIKQSMGLKSKSWMRVK